MGLGMIEAKEMGIISSMMDDIKVLKKRVEEMEERLQTLADMHSESEFDVRDEYLSHLDELEEKGKFAIREGGRTVGAGVVAKIIE